MYLILMVVGMILIFTAYDYKLIAPEQLPAIAQTYIKQNYPDCKILLAKKDYEFFGAIYVVKLDNGLDLNFDSRGVLAN